MSYKLFLDDIRYPHECTSYMHIRIGAENPRYLEEDWIIARSYEDFVGMIENTGLPSLVSFDHDLAMEHYDVDLFHDTQALLRANFEAKTGYDCAKWLVEYCKKAGNVQLPKIYIHSMNPAGSYNIRAELNKYEKFLKAKTDA